MTSDMWSRRDSYPPTQIHLPHGNKNEPRPLLEDMDENPLTYFLTPDEMDQDMDDLAADDMLFDAGIQDDNHPRAFVRSVSPSTLDGLSKLRTRAASPDPDSDVVTTDDDDDDDDDDIRFPPPTTSFLTPLRRSFRGSSADARAHHAKSPASSSGPRPAASSSSSSSSSSSATPPTASRGRPPRALRLWRQPSPDVWSISEETEEEIMSMGASAGSSDDLRAPSVKPEKRVRFLLSPRE
ncbi:hypothetical protein E4U42_006025 [Claviceps africana]|uniref:Uncharacterized protein n=1 Tax=Claviceps africana TaxID=83212 RepID=A0A8K0NFZ5_9HYPO|nr:hypothetical protein E4U42_006025 [Claviceps africana]